MLSNSSVIKLEKFISNERVQDFVYGLVIYSLLYPFDEVGALVISFSAATVKAYLNSKRYSKFDVYDLVATFGGAAFLMTWYNGIEYLKTFL